VTVLAGVGESFADTVLNGPLLLGMAVAALAGLVSFASPCVLPLVPGYLGYITGLSGADATDGGAGSVGLRRAVTGRAVVGTVLFVLGFTAVFVSYGAAFGNIGARLLAYQDVIQRVMGVVLILLGLAFLGLIPSLQRELRFRWLPRAGLAGAPLLGVLFGIGWTPCIGPTLGAVQTLAFSAGGAGRGAILSVFYSLGLGVPFILAAAGFRLGVDRFRWLRRGAPHIMRVGGVLLLAIGVLLVGGWWDTLMIQFRIWTSNFGTVI